jgi:hypothetical protein
MVRERLGARMSSRSLLQTDLFRVPLATIIPITAATTKELESRLAKVEKDLRELKTALVGKRSEPWYRQIVGDFAADKAFAEIVRLERAIRRGKTKT